MSHKLFRTCIFCTLLQLTLGFVAHGKGVVTWKALKQLDTLAERSEALCDQQAVAELRKLALPIKKAAAAVTVDPVPADAKDPDQVKVLQGDLKSLSDALTNPEQQDGVELTAILAGIHPIVEKLMEAAGMPHVHEDEGQGKEAKP
jgi:hypothetical protein